MADYVFRRGLYPYPLSYLPSDGGNDLTPFVSGDPTVLPDTTNWYVMCLTPEQLQAMRNIINIGAPIAYPNDYVQYWRLWAQIEQFPNEVPENSCMDFCQLVLDCINTNTDVQEAIASYTNAPTIPLDEPLNTTISNSDIIGDAVIVTCNPDNLFGATTGIVDFMNQLALDFIEIMSNNASIIGRVGDAIEGIPIIGELPVDDVLQLVESFVDDMEQLYQANYTVATRDDYRCELFCIALDNCGITFEQIYDFFEAELGSTVPTTSVEAFILWFATNSPANSLIVPAWHLFIAGLMRFGGSIFNIDSARLITMVSAMYNDPDPDWSTLCLCGWIETFDFTLNDGGFVATDSGYGTRGVWSSGNGWDTTDRQVGTATYRRSMSLLKSFTDSDVTSIRITYNYTKGTFDSGNDTALLIRTLKDTAVVAQYAVIADDMSNGTGQTEIFVDSANVDQILVIIASSSRPTASYDGSALLTECQVIGTGTNPF